MNRSVRQPAWITVGRIRGAFGIHGALKIEPFASAESSVLLSSRNWRLVATSPQGPRSGSPHADALPFSLPAEMRVADVKSQGDAIVATLQTPLTREAAASLKGLEIQIDRSEFPAPEEGEYYWSDLIGCRVEDPGGQPLGAVAEIEEHGAQLVLKLDNGLLIPFVASIVLDVDIGQRRLVADWSSDWA